MNDRKPRYRGPLRAVIFDWAGTVIDYGSRAPVLAVVRTFESFGVPVTIDEARGPMGMAKRAHLEALVALPRISSRWREVRGETPGASEVDQLYVRFLETQVGLLAEHAELIPGCLETVAECQRRDIRIGTSTGYTQELMDVLVPAARAQGFAPEASVCASDFAHGRPAPWMCLEIARRLEVYPMEAIVNVDDTLVGVEAGLNAGMWSVGVAKTGNLIGLSAAEFAALDKADQRSRLDEASAKFRRTGAHFVIDSVANLPAILDAIGGLLAQGELPATWPG